MTNGGQPPDPDELDRLVRRRLVTIRERIATVTDRPVEVVAVTKTWPFAAAQAAARAGADRLGESYAQEVVAKYPDGRRPLPLQFIGRLQTNKVRSLAGRVDQIVSVDRMTLVAEIARRMPGASVMIQVSTDGDLAKGGAPPDEVPGLVDRARDLGLVVDGLMTVGPTTGGPTAARDGFVVTRSLADRLGLAQCSMGMSDDLEIAVSCGSTQVRLGSALFGARQRTPGPPR